MQDVPRRLTVRELKAHWKRRDELLPGESITLYPISRMPSWDMICALLAWEHHLVDGGNFSAKSHGFCGVYRLIGLASQGDISKPATLNRLCGQDESGTLYIGEASDLSRRLNELRRSAGNRAERSHGAISMLRKVPCLDYPIERLGIALLFTGTHTRGVERDLILAYINTFGDAPPLNYRLSL